MPAARIQHGLKPSCGEALVKRIYVVGTADTKGEELAFLADAIAAARRLPSLVVDIGTRGASDRRSMSRPSEVAGLSSRRPPALFSASTTAARRSPPWRVAFARFIAVAQRHCRRHRHWRRRRHVDHHRRHARTAARPAQDHGLDAGLRRHRTLCRRFRHRHDAVGHRHGRPEPAFSRVVLHNAAQAIAGMARNPAPQADGMPSIGLTMFGVTTPCVTAIAEQLARDYDCMVFHATGTGGRTMEKLADSGMLAGVIDITTTEVCDLLLRRRLAGDGGSFRRHRPHRPALCRFGRRARHGQFLGAGRLSRNAIAADCSTSTIPMSR